MESDLCFPASVNVQRDALLVLRTVGERPLPNWRLALLPQPAGDPPSSWPSRRSSQVGRSAQLPPCAAACPCAVQQNASTATLESGYQSKRPSGHLAIGMRAFRARPASLGLVEIPVLGTPE